MDQSHHKGDVETPEWLVECKRTDSKAISLSLAVIEKIEAEAVALGKEPLIALEIGNRRVYVLMDYTFDVIRGQFGEEAGNG